MKVSVVIPYKQRLHNVGIAFATLAAQTMDRASFEVVVGAMEYCQDYVATCRHFADRLTIVSVLVDGPWNTSRARNIAIRQASGQVIVFLDADMAVPRTFLSNLYDRYYTHHQNVCIAGQMVGYDQTSTHDTDTPETTTYERCREILATYEAQPTPPLEDKRWKPAYAQAAIRFPWALLRTAVAAAPRTLIEHHHLLFDEGFRGWGAEDQEWAFRVSRTGTPILLQQDVYGLHLPHTRNKTANFTALDVNRTYFLAKWPCRDVELYRAFDWLEAAAAHPDVEYETAMACGDDGASLGVVHGAESLVVGVVLDAHSRPRDPEIWSMVDDAATARVVPLLGLALPFPDRSFATCRIMPPILRLSARYRDLVLEEATRVSHRFVMPR